MDVCINSPVYQPAAGGGGSPPPFVAAGAVSKVSSGDMTPGLPSGWAAGDVHLLAAIAQEGEALSVAGYTVIYNNENNDGGNHARPSIWWRRAVGGDAAPTVSGATSGAMSAIFGFRGCVASGDPYNMASENLPAGSLTATWNTITPGSANDMIVAILCHEDPFSAPSVSNYSGSNPTLAEGFDDFQSAGGSWSGIAMAYGISNTGAATGSRTAAIATTTISVYGAYLLALTPA